MFVPGRVEVEILPRLNVGNTPIAESFACRVTAHALRDVDLGGHEPPLKVLEK